MTTTTDETVCDVCGEETRITHTYAPTKDGKVIRRRKCDKCQLTFKTEAPEHTEKRVDDD